MSKRRATDRPRGDKKRSRDKSRKREDREPVERMIELEGRAWLRIQFEYDAELVDVVRSLPQRRWDWSEKVWKIPLEHMEATLGHLGAYGFALGPKLLAFCEEEGKAPEEMTLAGLRRWRPIFDEALLPPNTMTVAKLNHKVRDLIHESMGEDTWLVGELQGFDRNARGRHAFFELVERPWKGADPTARLQAVMFAPVREHIEEQLADQEDMRLRDGLAVRFQGRADLYTGHGRYQFVINDVDPSWSTGAIEQNRDAVIRKLEVYGILEKNRSIAWPACPLRLGVITSPSSDAYSDFIHELTRSGFGFALTVQSIRVQGADTEAGVLRALEYFAAHQEDFDAVAIVRGGGAKTDLAYFDTEKIGEAVCNHPVKIVCGVGHQRDVTLLDFVAHSEKTPTAAAQVIVERVREYLESQQELLRQIALGGQQVVQRSGLRLDQLAQRIERRASEQLESQRRRLDHRSYMLVEKSRAELARARRLVDRALTRAEGAARMRCRGASRQLELHSRRLEPATMRRLKRGRGQLDGLEHRLHLLDPQRVLERGYALVRQQGKLRSRRAQIDRAQPLQLQMADGLLTLGQQEREGSDEDE